jgi:hypothetical protein
MKKRCVKPINADTLYSFIGMDVRDEPIVITVPQVDQLRYYGCSIFDLWGHCDMFGTRTTGNDAASFAENVPGVLQRLEQPAPVCATSPIRGRLADARRADRDP